MATMTTTARVVTETEVETPTEVGTCGVSKTSEAVIVAAYRQDARAVKHALAKCSKHTTAALSLSRAAAVSLLGEDVYLGSHSWSTQEDFPVMYFAAKWGGPEVSKTLLEAGAFVAKATTLGVQPLHMAAQEGQAETARLLIQHGAPVNAVDRAGWSAFHYAANHRWATWVGDVGGQLNVLTLLKDAGADVDASDGEGYTCVHSAAQSGRVEMVRVLRKLGARPDATTVRGVAPVHVAAEGGRASVVEELLDWCPSLLETEDFRGHRPLHHAAYHGHADVVEVLLRRGAEACPGPMSSRGRKRVSEESDGTGAASTRSRDARNACATPLHLAARGGSLDAVVVLLAGGADPTVVDSRGWTPRRLAQECYEREQNSRTTAVTGGDKAENGDDESLSLAAAAKAKARLAVDAVLERAEAGTPLLWSRAVHHMYPTQFRRDTRALLIACFRITRAVRGLPADMVHDEALRAGARNVWPREISEQTWSAVERVRSACEQRWRSTEVMAGRLARGVGLGMGLEFGGLTGHAFFGAGVVKHLHGAFEDRREVAALCTAETAGDGTEVGVARLNAHTGTAHRPSRLTQKRDASNAPAPPSTPPGSEYNAGGAGAADGSVDDAVMDSDGQRHDGEDDDGDDDEVQSAPPPRARDAETSALVAADQAARASAQHAAMQRELFAMYETHMHFAAALAAQ